MSQEPRSIQADDMIELCAGTTYEGDAFYAFLHMTRQQYEAFMQDRATGDLLNLSDYGYIIEKGWGLMPPPHVVMDVMARHPLVFSNLERISQSAARFSAVSV